MFERRHVVAGFSAAIVLATSTVVVAEHTDHVPSSSIKPHSQLWTYEAPAKYGETPDERLSCGPSALERGKFVLESWGRLWCGPLDEATRTRECAVGQKPYDDAQVSFARGARLWVDESGQQHLVMAYRRDISDVSFAEMRRQRAFLDRIGTIDCETHGPRRVWHPKKRSPFAKKIERRLIKGDRALLPREPRLRQKIETEWEYMTGEGNGEACTSCGRNAPLCAECALVTGMGCNQYQSVVIAADTNGRVRIIELRDVEPGEVPFGQGASEVPVRASKH